MKLSGFGPAGKEKPGIVDPTGAPPGVGMGMTPPRHLRAGDVVGLGSDGLGAQRQDVRADIWPICGAGIECLRHGGCRPA